jgi:hypothetical protein
MFRFQKPDKGNRSNTIFPALMAYWFAYCLLRLDHNGFRHFGMDSVLASIMGLVAGLAWLISTPVRLRELHLNRFWTVALVAPFALSVLAIWKGWNIVCWISLAFAVLAQWLLVFLLPHRDAAPAGIEGRDEPTA